MAHSIRNNKLEAPQFFIPHFKGSSSQDQHKTLGCRLITTKVTLTGKSHFMLIFLTPQGHFTKLHQLRKVDFVESTHQGPTPSQYAVYEPAYTSGRVC